MRKTKSSPLDRAAQRTAEILLQHMSTLPPKEATAMREGIRKLAAKT